MISNSGNKAVKTSDTRSSEAFASSDFLTPQKHPIGVAAGVELQDLARRSTRQGSVVVSCIDYDADNLLVREIKDFAEFMAAHRPAWSKVRWINLRGLGDMHVIRALVPSQPIVAGRAAHLSAMTSPCYFDELFVDKGGEQPTAVAPRWKARGYFNPIQFA